MNLFLSLVFFAQAVSAQALTCRNLFENNQFQIKQYAKDQGLQETTRLWDRYLWWKLNRVWGEPDQLLTQESFDKKVERTVVLISKLRKSQDMQAPNGSEQAVYQWAEKSFLKEGLKGYWDFAKNEKLPARIYYRLTQILQSKPAKVLFHIYSMTLPNMKDKVVPEELMAKIMIDGIDPHFEELKQAYGLAGQSKVVVYRKIQRVLKYVVLMATIAVYGYIGVQKQIAIQHEQQVEQQKLNDIENRLEDIENELRQLSIP